MKTALAVAAVTGVAAAGAFVHAETRPRYGGSLEASLLGAPVTLDPVEARSHAELTVVDLVFDALYRVGPSGKAHPHLAAGPAELDATMTKAIITLRSGVKFHDGSVLTATDVATSLDRVRNGPASWALAPVASIAATGPATIELVLRRPISDLEMLLALPQTAVTKGGKPPAGDRAIGSGPFTVEALERPRKRIRLRAFEEHWGGRPYIDQLTLGWYDSPDGEARKFEDGRSQLSARGTAVFAGSQPKFRADDVEGPAALLLFVGFGKAHGAVTSDRSFRKALDQALARDAFKSVTSGERVLPARDPVPLEAGGGVLTASARRGDLASAQRELETAARRVPVLAPARLKYLRLEILVEKTRPDDRELAERVVRALDKLGIASSIKEEAAPTFRAKIERGQTDLWIGQIVAPVTSATPWWAAAFSAGNDAWAVRQLATGAIDPFAAQKRFAATLPIVPLMFRAVRLWHRTDVRGLVFDAAGRPGLAEVHLFGEPARSRGRP